MTTRTAKRVAIGTMRAIGTAIPMKISAPMKIVAVTLVGTSNTIETSVVLRGSGPKLAFLQGVTGPIESIMPRISSIGGQRSDFALIEEARLRMLPYRRH